MRKHFLQTLLVVVLSVIGVSQCWATNYLYPFSYVDYNSGACGYKDNMSISYNGMNHSSHGTFNNISNATYGDGLSLSIPNSSLGASTGYKCGFIMRTSYTRSVEPYTKVVLTYKYQLGCYMYPIAPTRASLYKFDNEYDALNTKVDWTYDLGNGAGSAYRFASVCKSNTWNTSWASTTGSTDFVFDNLTGTSEKSYTKWITLVLCEGTLSTWGDRPGEAFYQGAFKCTNYSFTTTYRKIITFDGNGFTGGSMSDQNIDNKGNLTTNAFTRTGYTFNGWNTEANGTGTTYANGAEITATADSKGPVTLYAQWKRTVTIDKQNGTSTSSIVVNCNSTYNNLPADPTRTGYTFNGWFDAKTGGNQYTKTTASTNEIPATLYAQWTAIVYNITYNVDGGSAITEHKTYTIETATFALPIPTKEGYTFSGWFTNGECTEGYTTQIIQGSTGNKTFYAKWTPITYNITYNENGGSEITEHKTYTIETETFDLPVPTKDGYSFGGWFTNEECTEGKTTQITQGSTGNKTFYAKWTPIVYNITYNVNEGSEITEYKTYTIETATFDLPVPTKDGYTFGGWFTNEKCTEGYTTQIIQGSTGNKEFYAKWNAIVYNITYNVNGGSAITGPNTYTIETATFALPIPTKEGYTFSGWFTNNDCTEGYTTQIIQGSIGNKTFYALWSENVVSDGSDKENVDEAADEVNTALSTLLEECKGGKAINLTINRTIYKDGYYNTLCLPFAMSAAQITETFGAYKELKQFASATVQGTGSSRSIVIEVENATEIEAGKAYLISFENNGEDLATLTFNNVVVSTTEATDESGTLAYQGILAPYQLPYEDQNYLFLGEKNALYWAINDGTFMKGFRAYFKVNTNPTQAPYRAGMRAAFGSHHTPTDLSPVVSGQEVRKLLEQGRVVIVNKGVKYNMNGATVQ